MLINWQFDAPEVASNIKDTILHVKKIANDKPHYV